MPGVDPQTAATDFASAGAALATTLAEYPHVGAEPQLKPYVFAR